VHNLRLKHIVGEDIKPIRGSTLLIVLALSDHTCGRASLLRKATALSYLRESSAMKLVGSRFNDDESAIT